MADDPISWREYHERTRHSVESLRRTAHFLDWANMPDPFRHYEGVPVLDLPANPPAPRMPALRVLQGAFGAPAAEDGPAFLSQLLFHSAAISAAKKAPSTGYRYALRVNPSSGNLHPTEFHFITKGVKAWPDGLYHYRPSSHMAEQRALGDFQSKLISAAALPVLSSFNITFVLTSIAWREAWKYRDRAYRYCLHDIGHAWQALALAARAMGCESFAVGEFPDDELAQFCRLNGDEWPMLIVGLRAPNVAALAARVNESAWFGGQANRLSNHQISYPLIGSIHAATKLPRIGARTAHPERAANTERAPACRGEIKLLAPALGTRGFGDVARMRRSALDFQGASTSMSLAELSAILGAAAQPLPADFSTDPFIQLYLYAHRVDGLERGVYSYWPDTGELKRIKSGDQRVAAAGLSLGQDLAGNACIAFSMIADLDRAVRAYADRGYRYAHFEAGAIGQRMYLGAEALGLQATGIGAFYDDEVQRYLGLQPEQGQVVYHFAIGRAVRDPRLDA